MIGAALAVAWVVTVAQPPAPEPQTAPPPAADPPPAPTAAPAGPKPLVEFPHPLITEVLYCVPTVDGDANLDGKRDVAGDEFVELVNPHDRPINLRGYRITDRNEPGRGQLKFVFPTLELPPGGIVVVFNGHATKWALVGGAVGDAKAAPAAGHGRFGGAMVLTMRAESERTSWANGGDWCLLSDPAGNPVNCVWWGRFAEKVPTSGLVEEAPATIRGSVQRQSLTADEFIVHPDVLEGLFSPGRFPGAGASIPPPSTPAAPADPAPTATAPTTPAPAAPAPPPPPETPAVESPKPPAGG